MSLDENELRKALEARSGEVTPEYRARVRQAMAESAPAPRDWMAMVAVLVVTVLTATSVGVLVVARHARDSGPVASAPRVTSPTPVPAPSPVAQASNVQLSAPSAGVVWALVDYGSLFRSTDSGDHWEERSLPANFGIRPSMSFISADEGWLLAPGSPTTQCGQSSADVWHTFDGAATWSHLQASGLGSAQCKQLIYFSDAGNGFISAWDDNHAPSVYRTGDAGLTWRKSTLSDGPLFTTSPGGQTLRVQWLRTFGATTYLEATASQPSHPGYPTTFIYTSVDGGASWAWKQKMASAATFMVTESRWLQLAPDVEESVNGGQAFGPYQTDLKVQPPFQAIFVNDSHGYVVAGAEILRTQDGGAHWTPVGTPWGSSPGSSPPAQAPTPSPASPARTGQACLSSPPPAASWRTYTDLKYGFTVSYPRGYTFEQAGRGNPDIGWLAAYRAVDDCYLGAYPGAQAEINVFTKDADSLTAWVTKHSRARCTDSGGYFWAVSNLKSTTAAGRAAATFDMDMSGCPDSSGVAHVTVFVLKSGTVFSFMWWSSDPGYAPTMQTIAEQMLASFKD